MYIFQEINDNIQEKNIKSANAIYAMHTCTYIM